MNNKIKRIASLFIILLIQVSVLNQISIGPVKINLMLIMTLYYSERIGTEDIPFFCLLLGFMYDVLLSPNLGIQALILFVISSVVIIIRGYVFSDRVRVDIFYGVIGTAMYYIINATIMYFLGLGINISIWHLLISTVINIIGLIGLRTIENKIDII